MNMQKDKSVLVPISREDEWNWLIYKRRFNDMPEYRQHCHDRIESNEQL
jgi:hypothetical protein